MKLQTLDRLIILAYFVTVFLLGLWVSQRGLKDLDSYFLGGKSLRWYWLGISDASGMFDITVRAAGRVLEFIETKLADRVHGEWFWKINPDGTPEPTLPKVSEWKGPYHGTRACLEVIRPCAA